jgi:hypothetical protein
MFVMKMLPVVFSGSLLVLIAAFGLHCLVLHCDRSRAKAAAAVQKSIRR